jgi:hypothetical protein
VIFCYIHVHTSSYLSRCTSFHLAHLTTPTPTSPNDRSHDKRHARVVLTHSGSADGYCIVRMDHAQVHTRKQDGRNTGSRGYQDWRQAIEVHQTIRSYATNVHLPQIKSEYRKLFSKTPRFKIMLSQNHAYASMYRDFVFSQVLSASSA